jgi:MFS family permease
MTESIVDVDITHPAAAPVIVTEGRGRFATTIVLGHAVKHMLASGLASVVIPEIKLTMGLSGTQVGALGSVQQFTGWFSTVSAGYLGDRFTSKTGVMLGISLFMTGFAMLILSLAPSYPFLLIGMLLMGMGPSMFHPPAVGALSRRFPDRRAFAISMHGTGGSIGEVLGPLAGAGALALLYWRDELKLSFVVAFITGFVMWRLLRGQDAHVHTKVTSLREYLGSFRDLLRQKTLRQIFLITAFRTVGQSTTAIFLPVYLREDLGYSSALVGVFIAMSQLAGIGSQPLMGALSDRLGHKAVILPALMCFTVILALIPLANGKAEMAVVILLLGLFVFSMQSILTSAAMEQAGEEFFSTATSLVYAASFLGSLAPIVAGVLADAYGLKSTFYFACALAAVATTITALTKFPSRHRADVPG